MAITIDDFSKIWASTSPLTPYEFSESNYKEGWNFIGGTPPSRQMWDFLQKNNDEKMQYLLNNFDNYLPLSGGTMTGIITMGTEYIKRSVDNASLTVCGGTSYSNGAYISLNGKDRSIDAGIFAITARGGAESRNLVGKPDGTLTWDGQPLLPVGIVQAFAGTTIPTGWLLCDGSAVSRTTYANLFACIGTTYGAGDGSTTFNLPNLVDKFIEGSATAGTEKSAGLPNITGEWRDDESRAMQYFSGAFHAKSVAAKKGQFRSAETYTENFQHCFDASLSNPIYGNSTTVQPPALTMRYIIKY